MTPSPLAGAASRSERRDRRRGTPRRHDPALDRRRLVAPFGFGVQNEGLGTAVGFGSHLLGNKTSHWDAIEMLDLFIVRHDAEDK